MIRLSVEHVDGVTNAVTKIGIMEIRRDADYAKSKASYRGQAFMVYPQRFELEKELLRTGQVKDWPRRSPQLWNLILRMLKDMFPEEK